jgi:uncharacterized protein YciI
MERPNAPLCVVLLTYTVPLDEIDAKMKAHIAWLDAGYDAGVFLASGRRVPRTGGVILVRGHEAEVAALIATDPFVESGAAEAEVIAFTASQAMDGLGALLA